MKQIPLLQGKALLIELPEGAKDPFVAKTYIDEDGHTYDTDPQWIEWSGTYPNSTIDLPPGNWRIIGMLSEVTEDQAAEIVDGDRIPFDETQGAYRDYTYKSNWGAAWLSSALESLESSILAEGWYFDNPIQTVDDNYAAIGDYYGNESRVLSRDRCLLLGRDDEN